MLPVTIKGLGYYLPENKVSSEALDKKLNLPLGSVAKKSGLLSRHFANKDETTSYMGEKAAKNALHDAGLTIKDIDLIIGACGVGQQAIPCNAALFQKALRAGTSGIPCFDINSTCLSFLSALELAAYLIVGKRYKNILIISSELPSKGLNWNDLETCTIFGDGAAACVLGESSDGSGILASYLETHSIGSDFCKIEAGGTLIPPNMNHQYPDSGYFYMDGKKVFKHATKMIHHTMAEVLKQSQVSLSDIDLVIPHQASKLALHHVRKQLNLSEEKFGIVYEHVGNQIAASIPTAMCLLRQENRLKRGQLIYLLGTGAGLASAGMVLIF